MTSIETGAAGTMIDGGREKAGTRTSAELKYVRRENARPVNVCKKIGRQDNST
jgi:hypothetical protein